MVTNNQKNLVPNFQLCTLMWLHNSQRIYGTDTIRFYKRLRKVVHSNFAVEAQQTPS